ncbi:hypothetical protein PVAP13_9KG027570 [Panicum virgatum]|uniref:Uncharacterized protein n=1 Tax=Panicum virgatum TaxID=38727 RepID=A0A8T0N995_PANVG|nr:hypothetical protein PVAP13_9KG027570 [Panicum virgatum]
MSIAPSACFMAVEGNDVRSEDACDAMRRRGTTRGFASDQASFPMTHGMAAAAIPRARRRELVGSLGASATSTNTSVRVEQQGRSDGPTHLSRRRQKSIAAATGEPCPAIEG